MQKVEKKEKLFLLLLFFFGVAFLFSYGAHLDQESEKRILYSNILAYGNELVPQSEFCQKLVDRGIIDIRNSDERDHGMSAFYPMFWIYSVDGISSFVGNIIWHLYIYLFCFGGVIALYCLLREIFSKRTAIITTLLYFFTPRIFAEMHYNNKDMVVLSLVLIVFYLGYRLLVNTSYADAVLFAIAGAFLANMKIIGLFIWGFVGICVAIIKLLEKQKSKYLIVKVVLSILSACVVFMVITPAAWGDVTGYFKYVIESAKDFRWEGIILFNGKIIIREVTGFPRSYLPITILVTIPIGVLVLSFVGGIISLFSIVKKGLLERKSTLYLLTAVCGGMIPLAYAVLNATPLYNGWRHMYFSYSAFVLLAAMGIHFILEKANGRIVTSFIGIYLLIMIVGVVINHPYQYGFVNLFAGKNVEERYELDYWDMSVRQALEYIFEYDEDGDIVLSACDNFAMYGINENMPTINPQKVKEVDFDWNWQNAEYVIINRTYSQLYNYEGYLDVKESMDLIFETKSYGNVMCEVYHKK